MLLSNIRHVALKCTAGRRRTNLTRCKRREGGGPNKIRHNNVRELHKRIEQEAAAAFNKTPAQEKINAVQTEGGRREPDNLIHTKAPRAAQEHKRSGSRFRQGGGEQNQTPQGSRAARARQWKRWQPLSTRHAMAMLGTNEVAAAFKKIRECATLVIYVEPMRQRRS